MLLQANCQGYVTAQYLQPEPAKYSRPPLLEQQTFMQPERPYFAHHPGRFFYVKDEETGVLFSAPHAPVKHEPDEFVFSVGDTDLRWRVRCNGVSVDLRVSLPPAEVAELWTIDVTNDGSGERALSVYPSFTIGYMSWMNQSARYDEGAGGIIASCVTPYQKLSDYDSNRRLKDLTCLLHDVVPVAWEASQAAFEGNGGLHAPDSVRAVLLGCGNAHYEVPAAVLQYRLRLPPGASRNLRFVFAPARDLAEVRTLRARLLAPVAGVAGGRSDEAAFERQLPCLRDVATPDRHFDVFVNRFLGRQVLYHGDVNRMTTDPQTRNFLQDGMGMVYVDPGRARQALLTALAQQEPDGNLPEGIRLATGTELKYINQVPHTDHCVWLPVFLEAWLDETGDYSLLDKNVPGADERSVFDAVTAAMRWLIANRDGSRLSLIAQGDWCDPMNMVGPEGKGVSGWLSIATVHALRLWAGICETTKRDSVAAECRAAADESAAAVQALLWDGNWFARGITDAGVPFGVASDVEGRLYLNPQSWSILAGISSPEQCRRILAAIDTHLESPYGTMMLAPAYTAMREDIGRITQKFPGTAENGSVYNHAVAFYVAALYALGESDRAWTELRRTVPGPGLEDYLRRGQLPVYLPNYYRGAWQQFPAAAGRSSHLCHTGAASWFYRLIVEQLFGLQGCVEGLRVRPRLPTCWSGASVTRRFRGAELEVRYTIDDRLESPRVRVDGRALQDDVVRGIEAGRRYRLEVACPRPGAHVQQGQLDSAAAARYLRERPQLPGA
jgi:cellobionic acid phosphorylase